MRGTLTFWKLRLGLESPPSTGVREALQWLMLARLGLLYLVLSVIVLQQVFRRESLPAPSLLMGYGLLATSFGFNFIHALLVDRLPQQWWVAASHIVFDALVTSVWIYFTGGKESLFALLYLVQILAVSLIFYQKGAWFVSIVSCLLFGVVSVLSNHPFALVNWAAYSVLFLTLGLVGGYLSEELLRAGESLKEKSRRIEKLTELQARLISNLPTGVLTVDRELRVNFINPAGAHILAADEVGVVGRPLSEVERGLLPFFTHIEALAVPRESDEALGDEDPVTSLSATGSEHHRSFFVQAKLHKGQARLQQRVEIGKGSHRKILRGDVAELDVEAGVSGLLGKEATGGWVLLFQDVTKLLHLEEKVKQNEKLAAVGQLAAGIAHEIRNPLASMSASIEMLKGSLPPDRSFDENQKLMEIAIREIDRLNRLVSEFLDFVKPEKFRFQKVDLKALLAELVLQAKGSRDFKDKISLRESYQPGSFALANSEKLKQVAWNLLQNAMQAMNRPGSIDIGCAVVSDQRVKFWVEDQGAGMDEEVLAHLYEPFFTTKDKGTGLGLATAYKIIEAHHGEIRVTSTVGAGTRFEVVLQTA